MTLLRSFEGHTDRRSPQKIERRRRAPHRLEFRRKTARPGVGRRPTCDRRL